MRREADESTSSFSANGPDGHCLPRGGWSACVGHHVLVLQQLLLPGHRLPRLPDELRLLLLLLPVRVQHEVRHVYWLLQVLRAELL